MTHEQIELPTGWKWHAGGWEDTFTKRTVFPVGDTAYFIIFGGVAGTFADIRGYGRYVEVKYTDFGNGHGCWETDIFIRSLFSGDLTGMIEALQIAQLILDVVRKDG